MMKFLGFLLLLLCSTPLFSQKVMEKSMDISEIKRVIVEADDVYHIKVTTAAHTTAIKLRAIAEGEYAENIVLDMKQKDATLTISPGFTPYFLKDNDKLAAHKVMAVNLELVLPEGLYVTINSKTASVTCAGSYKYLQMYLSQGSCNIANIYSNGLVQTKQGNVTVKHNTDLGVLAFSQYGKIAGTTYNEHHYKLEVNTVNGNITILETN